jgi:hypothetical protein
VGTAAPDAGGGAAKCHDGDMLAARARRVARRLCRPLLAMLLGVGFVALGGAPAGAHGLTGAQPSNYESRVLSVSPRVPGIVVRIRDLGARLEVRNDTASDVTVLGYSGEPYLRIGPDGVYENRRSPAVFLNRSTTVTAAVPRSYDAAATPVWRRVDGAHVARWHDHRVHWMGTSLPPAVAAAPGRVHLIADWQITLRYHGEPVTVRGDLRWIPGPSALPRLGLALLVAIAIVALGLTRRWGDIVAFVLIATAVIVLALVAGEWSATSAGAWIAFLSTVYSILGAAIALAAAGSVVRARRTPDAATPIVLVAAVVLTLGSGLADITALDRSQLPTTLSPALDRTFVALVLGASVGVLVTAARRLRATPSPAASVTTARPAPG